MYRRKRFLFDTPSSQNKILPRREKSRDESKSWNFYYHCLQIYVWWGISLVFFFFPGWFVVWLLYMSERSFFFFSPNYVSLPKRCYLCAPCDNSRWFSIVILHNIVSVMYCFFRAKMYIEAKRVCDLFSRFFFCYLSKHRKTNNFLCVSARVSSAFSKLFIVHWITIFFN